MRRSSRSNFKCQFPHGFGRSQAPRCHQGVGSGSAAAPTNNNGVLKTIVIERVFKSNDNSFVQSVVV
ncbi:hypothetical protein F511_23018 [Dorcoceras hygrometricum]|uniref:Uncharacterized protein n=1 Tax=Dorcoceras hygrometricum TaxID=472368 RepID=A0A2Z7BEL2_9LAMI|nr:hypothetical protein F511_23018 [Dorcoceras hygrometricum]